MRRTIFGWSATVEKGYWTKLVLLIEMEARMVIIYQTKNIEEECPHTWKSAGVQGSDRKREA